MADDPLTLCGRRKSRRLAFLCFKYTDSQRKSVVLSSDFAAANQRRDRLPLCNNDRINIQGRKNALSTDLVNVICLSYSAQTTCSYLELT